jgi:hypothetical protein
LEVQGERIVASLPLHALGDEHRPAVHDDLTVDLTADVRPPPTSDLAVQLSGLAESPAIEHKHITVGLSRRPHPGSGVHGEITVHLATDRDIISSLDVVIDLAMYVLTMGEP